MLSFGDPLRADVATLGINPSRQEFYSTEGELLTGAQRRLATTESLGITAGQPLTEDQARTVVAESNDYFARDPYNWFNPLEALLNTAAGASYYDRSACHLDLVQWATDPVWGKLTDRGAAALLFEEGQPHLETLLARSNVHLVLLNGATVVEQLQNIGLARLRRIAKGNTTCRLVVGEGHGISYVGWATNLQTSFGVSKEFKQRLAGEVKQLVEALLPARPTQVGTPMSTPDIDIDDNGFLPRRVKVSGKRDFADLLRRWHDEGEAETIGDVGGFGGTACITVELGDHDVVLNVDSKRRAVATYLDHVRRLGPDLPWRVVANHRGTVNKVVAAQARAIVPDGVEAAIEPVGTNTLPDTLRATAVHGVVCFTGMLSNQWTVADFYPIEYIPTGVRLTAYGGDAADLPTDVLQAYLDAVAAGRLTVPIDRTYALDEIAQAHADMEHGRAPGKLVVLP